MDMKIITLGTAANGAVPQWDCGCPNCQRARNNRGFERTHSSLAIALEESLDTKYVLIDAAPELKYQLERAHITPMVKERQCRIDSIFLTHAHYDHIGGVGMFSTGKSFELPLYASPDLLDLLFGEEHTYHNDIGRLGKHYIKPTPIKDGERMRVGDLVFTPFEVPHTDNGYPSKTYGYEVYSEDDGAKLIYTPDIKELTPELFKKIEGADMYMLDGSFWSDDELVKLGIQKTSHDLGHVAMVDSMELLLDEKVNKKIYTHINHTNAVLNPRSNEARILRKKGYELAGENLLYVT